jgi:hypothetical protein
VKKRKPPREAKKLLGATVGITLKKEDFMLELPKNIAKTIPIQLFCTAFIFIMILNQRIISTEISDYKC